MDQSQVSELLSKYEVPSEALRSATLNNILLGNMRWLNSQAAKKSNVERLTRQSALGLLNDCQAMAALGQEHFGLHKLQSLLRLHGYSYLGGIWNFFPTTHQNIWKQPPQILSSYDFGWKYRYWIKGWGMVDPAIRTILACKQAVHWFSKDFDGAALKLGQAAIKANIHEGVTIPVFRPGTEIGLFTVVPAKTAVVTGQDLFDSRFGLKIFAEEFHELAIKSNKVEAAEATKFSHREKQVLTLIIEGLRNVEIADHLQLSESMVKKHQQNIQRKLKVGNRNDIAPEAIAVGYTSLALGNYLDQPTQQDKSGKGD